MKSDAFEKRYVAQDADEDRSITDTLTLAWNLLSMIPKEELKRIDREYIEKYFPS